MAVLVVYLLIPTSNHNLVIWWQWLVLVVYLLIPTSNHNLSTGICTLGGVVYLLIPTSNHNAIRVLSKLGLLYIFWFLHQTTTERAKNLPNIVLYIFWFLHQTTTALLSRWVLPRCISFDSYIKPQLLRSFLSFSFRCISFDSYIKPQPYPRCGRALKVVYLLIPTSNHNR